VLTGVYADCLPRRLLPARARGIRLVLGAERAIEALVDALFSLDEPWRGRFLDLVAEMATGGEWNEHAPSREQVLAWLESDVRLYRDIALMLNTWCASG